MRYILDTHAVIWLAINSPMLSKSAKRAIFDKDNEFFVSVASAWETAIKVGTDNMVIRLPKHYRSVTISPQAIKGDFGCVSVFITKPSNLPNLIVK